MAKSDPRRKTRIRAGTRTFPPSFSGAARVAAPPQSAEAAPGARGRAAPGKVSEKNGACRRGAPIERCGKIAFSPVFRASAIFRAALPAGFPARARGGGRPRRGGRLGFLGGWEKLGNLRFALTGHSLVDKNCSPSPDSDARNSTTGQDPKLVPNPSAHSTNWIQGGKRSAISLYNGAPQVPRFIFPFSDYILIICTMYLCPRASCIPQCGP